MAKDLDVTYQDMRDAAKHVVKEKEKLHEKLDALRKYIANLVESGYVTKSSSKAFDDNFDEFVRGTKDTIEGLDGMGDYLANAADKFEQIDEELANAARSK
ncbi:WXG100 family type VII secretion target [Streptomyces sp. NPDC054834]